MWAGNTAHGHDRPTWEVTVTVNAEEVIREVKLWLKLSDFLAEFGLATNWIG